MKKTLAFTVPVREYTEELADKQCSLIGLFVITRHGDMDHR